MAEPAKKKATYEDLYTIHENMVGEIIGGEFFATPRPSRAHVYAASALGLGVGPAYQFGQGGGPGGWIILYEPEISLGENILVPDLAGWRRERFPVEEDHNSISEAPEWACGVPSPSTLRKDKIRKMPIYGQHGVPYFWLIDPIAKTLDVFCLESGKWVVAGVYADDDKVRAEPFQEVEIDLSNLWLK